MKRIIAVALMPMFLCLILIACGCGGNAVQAMPIEEDPGGPPRVGVQFTGHMNGIGGPPPCPGVVALLNLPHRHPNVYLSMNLNDIVYQVEDITIDGYVSGQCNGLDVITVLDVWDAIVDMELEIQPMPMEPVFQDDAPTT